MIPEEVLTKFETIQAQLWPTVSIAVSEASGQAITLTAETTGTITPVDVAAEFGEQSLAIQFALSSQADSSQVILLSPDSAAALAGAIKGTKVLEVDENVLSDLRATLEGIVQGLCLGVGTLNNDTVVASGLTCRFQPLQLPGNLQNADSLACVRVTLAAEELEAKAIWLLDTESVHAILGLQQEEEEEAPAADSPFGQVEASSGASTDGAAGGPPDDAGGLELLMDIPLEISVELGRVKMLVKEVVELGTGSIVEIDKAAGEPVDVMVNGRPVARGEVVVIEDNFGVRITEILNPMERLAKLGDAA